MVKEIAVSLVKPLLSASAGVIMTSLVEMDSFNSVLRITEDHEFIKTIVAVVGLVFFFWKAYNIADKTIKEKGLANESARIKNDSDKYDLAKKQEDDKNEGITKEIKEMRDAFTELTQTIKNQNK